MLSPTTETTKKNIDVQVWCHETIGNTFGVFWMAQRFKGALPETNSSHRSHLKITPTIHFQGRKC